MLGHYHHPMFHGPSAEEFPDVRPPWVRFMEENPDLPLTQNPRVLSYVGQMAAWTATYMLMALENEEQRVPVYEVIQQIMTENPFSDLRVGRGWRMHTTKTGCNAMKPRSIHLRVVKTLDQLNNMLNEIEE